MRFDVLSSFWGVHWQASIKSISSSIQLKGKISVLHLRHIQISLFSSKRFCSSAFKVIHFMWYFCKQLQHFILYEWLWTSLLQIGQHVMVLTSGIKHPFLHSAIEIDHKIATQTLLNCSSPPANNIQNDHCIYPSKQHQHKQHRVPSEMSAYSDDMK